MAGIVARQSRCHIGREADIEVPGVACASSDTYTNRLSRGMRRGEGNANADTVADETCNPTRELA